MDQEKETDKAQEVANGLKKFIYNGNISKENTLTLLNLLIKRKEEKEEKEEKEGERKKQNT